MAKYFQRKLFMSVRAHQSDCVMINIVIWNQRIFMVFLAKNGSSYKPKQIGFKIAGGQLDNVSFTKGRMYIWSETIRINNGWIKLFVLAEMGLKYTLNASQIDAGVTLEMEGHGDKNTA